MYYDFRGSWDKHLSLAEFAYNNNYHSSIGMTPYEALYDKACRSPSCCEEVRKRHFSRLDLVQESVDKILIVQ